jgi:hypothetical protein
VLASLFDWLPTAGLALVDMTASPIRGPAGNVEFLTHIRRDGATIGPRCIDVALEEAARLREAAASDG